MPDTVFRSRFMPCPDCGESVDRAQSAVHCCDAERLLDYQMFGLRETVDLLEEHLRDHLDTSTGRFEVWLAARDVRRRAA